VTTILLNAVFNPPLEIVYHWGQQLLIDSEHFLPDGILQLIQITGFVSVYTALQVFPEEEITWWQVRWPWGPWHIAKTRFLAEDWKLHSRGWSSPKWHYFLYL